MQRIIATNLSEEMAHILEKEHIAKLRAAGAQLVNMTEGGEGLSNPSFEVRIRIGTASKVRQNTPEAKAAVSAVHKGKKVSETTREKLRARVVSEETRTKISKKAKKQFENPLARHEVSQRTKARFADPRARDAAAERTKAQFADPRARDAAAERTKAQFADPEKKERHRQACLAAAARRKNTSKESKKPRI